MQVNFESNSHCKAAVIADSSLSDQGMRLVTLLIEYPKIIDAEVLTHRMSAKNSQSSRAIGSERLLKSLESDESLFIPLMRAEKKGMVDAGPLEDSSVISEAEALIRKHAEDTKLLIKKLHELGLHHQIANRYAEPFIFTKRIMTAAYEWWQHFIKLRKNEYAEPHMQLLADVIERAINKSDSLVTYIHIPFNPRQIIVRKRYERKSLSFELNRHRSEINDSIARCARISYLNYDKNFTEAENDAFVAKLWSNEHRSPFEHVCIGRFLFNEFKHSPSCMGDHWLTYRLVRENAQSTLSRKRGKNRQST